MWQYCSKLREGSGNYLVCGMCDRKLKTTNAWSSSTIINHLKKKHGVSRDTSASQTTLTSRRLRSKATQEGLDVRIVQCIVKDLFPVSLTEKIGFRSLIKYLAPDSNVISRHKIIKAMYMLEEIGKNVVIV